MVGVGVTRARLTVALSHDAGATWRLLANLEPARDDRPGQLVHYPTLVEDGCRLLVVYSIAGEGIRLASVPLTVSQRFLRHHQLILSPPLSDAGIRRIFHAFTDGVLRRTPACAKMVRGLADLTVKLLRHAQVISLS